MVLSALSVLLARGYAEGRLHFSSGALLNRLDDVRYAGQVPLDPVDDFFVDVGVVVQCHPLLAQVLPQQVGIECELQEHVHLGGLLAHHQFLVVGRLQLVKAEEGQIGEDLVQGVVVAVGARRVLLKEDFGEDLVDTVRGREGDLP